MHDPDDPRSSPQMGKGGRVGDWQLRRAIAAEEFDYQTLVAALRDYSRPRDRITDLLAKGVIVRVRKGLYVFGDEHRLRPFSRGLLANLVHGPSYVSLEWALHHHGLIPERAETVTSVTTKRSRLFETPVGTFSYRGIPVAAFRVGMDRVEIDGDRPFLIATPEKALADLVAGDRRLTVRSRKGLRDYLIEDLRVDPGALRALDSDRMAEAAAAYGSQRLRLLATLLRKGVSP